jgi:hypothetical protein
LKYRFSAHTVVNSPIRKHIRKFILVEIVVLFFEERTLKKAIAISNINSKGLKK